MLSVMVPSKVEFKNYHTQSFIFLSLISLIFSIMFLIDIIIHDSSFDIRSWISYRLTNEKHEKLNRMLQSVDLESHNPTYDSPQLASCIHRFSLSSKNFYVSYGVVAEKPNSQKDYLQIIAFSASSGRLEKTLEALLIKVTESLDGRA